MRTHAALLSVILVTGAAMAAAQAGPKTPNPADIYCSGVVSHEPTKPDHYIISGPESYLKAWFGQREQVFINRGSGQGVRVGDEYWVTRPVKDRNPEKWFRWQRQMMNAMGTLWLDIGRIRVVHVQPEVSVAEVIYACDAMQRGDHIRPFAARPAPPLRHEPINPLAPETRRGSSMVVLAKDFRQSVGANDIIYINAGSSQGVNVGDYVRIFRYQASRYWKVFADPHTAHRAYGFGRTPRIYHHDQLPRDIAGEGIVLRTTANSSTVLITSSVREIYLGYYVELK